ncbi:hypothetical protein Cni_G12219 [Canna indica]|uniref:Hemerythrin-like domain-containing protein n=1 Tax=Canna indica TaxID=4628 RepID=A0AAQ3K8Z9_9LILI|nr:hypothetical protein Cni_G12219 [Canna indica]
MGNCAAKPKPRSRLPPLPSKPSPPAVRLYGSESCLCTSLLRLALLYKSVPFQFFPRDSPLLGRPFLQCGADTVVGADDTLLREVDSMFPCPPAASPSLEEARRRKWQAAAATTAEEVALATALQHRSVERHVEELARWAAEMAAGGTEMKGEAARMGKSYGQLMEVVLEHAQMEERLLFPTLEAAADPDRALCKVANEEHGRDLPIINGIMEDIKSTVVMEAGTSFYQEALRILSSRFKTLEEHFKKHFQGEEKNLLPLLEMAITIQREEGEDDSPTVWMNQVMQLMEATHSPRLFPFFMAGLLPEEAVQYIGIICRYTMDQHRLISMLQSLIIYLETKHTPLGNYNGLLRRL